MLHAARRILQSTDAATAALYLSLFRERNALLSFLFHGLFKDEAEIAKNEILPQQRTTVSQFRRFVAYYVGQGYRFIGPADIVSGLDPSGRYALISFDDGYFNNIRALPVLEEFKVPAVFFIATENVLKGKCFWWDVHWRQSLARGMSEEEITREGRLLKSLRTEQIEEELLRQHGAPAFAPRGDLDRAFNPSELRDFAASPWVQLGNHTSNHGILTNYPLTEALEQIELAQEAIASMTGARPLSFAYPNGNHSPQVERLVEKAGIRCAFTVVPGKTSISALRSSSGALRIGRFSPIDRGSMERQCRTFRSDVQLYGRFHAGYQRFAQRRANSASLMDDEPVLAN